MTCLKHSAPCTAVHVFPGPRGLPGGPRDSRSVAAARRHRARPHAPAHRSRGLRRSPSPHGRFQGDVKKARGEPRRLRSGGLRCSSASGGLRCRSQDDCLDLAWLWRCGSPDGPTSPSNELRRASCWPEQTGQPLTLTYVFTLLAWLHFYRREPEAAERWAGEAIALCRQHGFNQWLAFATMYLGMGPGGARTARGGAPRHAVCAYRVSCGRRSV